MMGSGTIPVLAGSERPCRGRPGHGPACGDDRGQTALMDGNRFDHATPGRGPAGARFAIQGDYWPDHRDKRLHQSSSLKTLMPKPVCASLACAIASGRRRSPCARCALSRLIITKDAGASRARDVSHSRPPPRPHKRELRPARPLRTCCARRSAVLIGQPALTRPTLSRLPAGKWRCPRHPDSRKDTVDVVISAPPYLRPSDYLRGHRLSLIWFGHSIVSCAGSAAQFEWARGAVPLSR